jgi:hypothetical protein
MKGKTKVPFELFKVKSLKLEGANQQWEWEVGPKEWRS